MACNTLKIEKRSIKLKKLQGSVPMFLYFKDCYFKAPRRHYYIYIAIVMKTTLSKEGLNLVIDCQSDTYLRKSLFTKNL